MFNTVSGYGPPASPAEQLTAAFYEWEIRGRGWQVWPYPVALEPPFRPFLFPHTAKHTVSSGRWAPADRTEFPGGWRAWVSLRSD
jgi:hypothetical protein